VSDDSKMAIYWKLTCAWDIAHPYRLLASK
jgi:hypothetical protein